MAHNNKIILNCFSTFTKTRTHKLPNKIRYSLPGETKILVRRGDSDINRDPYNIVASLIIERTPVIRPAYSKAEQEFMELREKNSIKRGKQMPQLLSQQLPEKHKFWKEKKILTPKLTRADVNDDFKSHHRQLGDHLYLIVKKKRENHAWQFLQGIRTRNETIRETAERQCKKLGGNIKVYMTGNMPLGYMKYDYIDKKPLNKRGAKVFFLKAHYIEGSPDFKNTDKNWNKLPKWAKGHDIEDFLWLNKRALEQYLHEDLYRNIRDLLN